MRIDELEKHEKLALGGLIRIILRADGEFAEDEEDAVDSLGDDVGGKAAIWRIVSDSAQALRSNDAVRDAAIRVTRPDARAVIRAALARVAAAGSVVASEQSVLDWLDTEWRALNPT